MEMVEILMAQMIIQMIVISVIRMEVSMIQMAVEAVIKIQMERLQNVIVVYTKTIMVVGLTLHCVKVIIQNKLF